MHRLRKPRIILQALSSALFLVLFCIHSLAQPVRANHLTVELVTETKTIAPNHDFLAGLHFVLDKGWHIYWMNAGDAGEPPRVDWKLPAGISAGEIQFPAPKRLPLGPLMDFGYENEVLLPIPMRADGSLKPGSKETLRGHLHFLVCSNVCIPGKADLEHSISVAAQPGVSDSQVGPLFLAAEQHLPRMLPAGAFVNVAATKTAFIITLHTGQRIDSAEFYPFDPNVIANAAPQTLQPLTNGIRITVPKAQDLQKIPSHLHGLLKLPDGTAYQFTSAVTTARLIVTSDGIHLVKHSLLGMLGLAFLGGLILNLMPCVFPVLFIKGLSLVQSSGDERKRLRAHGAVYTLGILVSFWAIVALLLLLRGGAAISAGDFNFSLPTLLLSWRCCCFSSASVWLGNLRLAFPSPAWVGN